MRQTPRYQARTGGRSLTSDLDAWLRLDKVRQYVPVQPTIKQIAFLLAPEREVLYGGAAGGAKSYGLLMAALQYVDVPRYHALILRKTFAQLVKADSLIPLAHEWLQPTDATWNEQKHMWTFPSGATLEFGHMENRNARYDYQGAAYQFIGWDELTQHEEDDYTYVSFSRRRRALALTNVPIRVRATANPGGIGHEWVYQRFMVESAPDRAFIPSKLTDNPHLDQAEYRASLAQLDPVTRVQLEHGNWEIRPAGNMFSRSWFEVVDVPPARLRLVRYWDQASTEEAKGKDPDWTVGVLLGRDPDGVYYVLDVQRFRARPLEKEQRMRQTAETDGTVADIWFEQEGGSSGVDVAERLVRVVFHGYNAKPDKKTGSKITRAKPVSAQAEAGNIKLVRGAWNKDLLDELEPFPQKGVHDDQVDALSGAFYALGITAPFNAHEYARANEQLRRPGGSQWSRAR